jgi:hypothetical protein
MTWTVANLVIQIITGILAPTKGEADLTRTLLEQPVLHAKQTCTIR